MEIFLNAYLAITNTTIVILLAYGIRVTVDTLNKLSMHLGAMRTDVVVKNVPKYSEKDVKMSEQMYRMSLQAMKNYNNQTTETRIVADVVMTDRSKSEAILKALNDLISTYGIAMLTDFYELVDLPAVSVYEDSKWGWDDLTDATIKSLDDNQWAIGFPPLRLLSELQVKTAPSRIAQNTQTEKGGA